jgi:two-component system, OmpR family, response regulator
MSMIARAASHRHSRTNPNRAIFLGRDGRWSCKQPATLERDRLGNETDRAGHILVVDEDRTMQRAIISYFEQHNVPTSAVSSQHELRHRLAGADLSLIILDVKLDENERFSRLIDIRSYSNIPIIIMTDDRCDEFDHVVGLELGADDCITKPLGLRELLARVRAVLRRQEIGRAARIRDPERGVYRFIGCRLERRNRRLVDPRGTPIPLTKCEYALLLAFRSGTSATAHARATATGNSSPRRSLRSERRCSGLAIAAKVGDQSGCAPSHPDRAGFRICLCPAGGTVLSLRNESSGLPIFGLHASHRSQTLILR